jgi:hypothetical protein
MHAALVAVPAATNAITLPLVLTVTLATVAMLGIAIYVRRVRRDGRLTGVTAAASGVSAAGILVSALLVSVALGGATAATASPATTPSSVTVQSPTGDLSGYQLPTE